MAELINPFVPLDDKSDQRIMVDNWIPEPEDMIFKHVKGAVVLPVSKFYNVEDNPNLDCFILSTKRCYNNEKVREHICHYLNYFEKFYDLDKSLLMIYYKLKFLIDYEPAYTKEAFIYDIKKYILSEDIHYKLKKMNADNYTLVLTYKNNKTPALQYTKRHGMILMEISLFMDMCIPLLTHFIFVNKIQNVKMFLLEVFDIIFDMYEDVDIYNKLYETSISNVNRNRDHHQTLWNMQGIRGINPTIHSLATVENIILQIMPKYNYSENIICFNYKSIRRNIGYQVIDISYEYKFVSLSNSRRDEDNNSEFDKFESRLIKQDEALYIQNKVNCEHSMQNIDIMFGPFDPAEIDFYRKELMADGKSIINSFQKDLVFNLFYKYFGDPVSIKAINSEDYVKLVIASKKILEANGMVILPYIISGRVNRLVTRKNINKKELMKLESSPYYQDIKAKYRNEKIEKYILSIVAVILSSEFCIIDYNDPELNGKKIDVISDYIIEEVLMYILLI